MPFILPGDDVPHVRAADAPARTDRIRDYLSDTGDPNHLFRGPIEVQARFSPHASPLRALADRQNADL